jgi:hypothetical protein
MRLCIKLILCFIFVLTSIVYLFIHKLSDRSVTIKSALLENDTFKSVSPKETYHVWVTFTKASSNGGLLYKFESMFESILVHSRSVTLHLNVITDTKSEDIARAPLQQLLNLYSPALTTSFYDIDWCADQIRDIIDCMRPHFSSQPGI